MMKKRIKICFLADKHSLFDDRIYWKMAVLLNKRGFEVYYLLIGNENKRGITKEGINYEILKLKTFSNNRYLNFILKRLNPKNNYKLLFKKAAVIEADIYHFHDLWINRIAVKLKYLENNPVVFYDAREPYAEDYNSLTNTKGLLNKSLNIFSLYVDKWEKSKAKNYDLVIANENTVRDNFRNKLGKEKAVSIFNYTDLYKNFNNLPLEEKEYDFIYCGGVTQSRGAMEILEATKIVVKTKPKIKVVFVGRYSPDSLKFKMQNFIENNNLTNNVELFSFVNYTEISDFYNKSKVGLITWLPVKALSIKMPIKIFEYMAFGLPIIGSNFGHIKEYVVKENCGIVVNPNNTKEIAHAMIEILSNIDKYKFYSENGRTATLNKFKWEIEFQRLLDFYKKALNERDKKY